MVIEIKYTDKETNEIIKTTKDVFTKDRDALRFLKNVERNKMQSITDKLGLGTYKPSLIVKNAGSIYSERQDYHRTPSKKPLYDKFVECNTIKIDVKIINNCLQDQ